MKKNSNQNLVFTIVFILIVVGVLTYYFSKTDNPKNNSTTSASQSPGVGGADVSSQDLNINYAGTIYYLKKDGDISQIYSKTNSTEEKLIFTDKDEDNKIKFVGGMSDSGKILVYMAPNNQMFGGSLYLISSDGNKENIIDSFTTSQTPIVSPDGEKIAYILFSNAEYNYGFSLYVMDKNGQNKIKIDSNENTIPSFDFSADSKYISYTKMHDLYTSNIDGTNQQKIASLDQNYSVSGLSWETEDKILINLNNSNTNASKIISVNSNNSAIESIYEGKTAINDKSIWASSEKDKIFYINSDNKLNIIDLKNNSSNIGSAQILIKWLK